MRGVCNFLRVSYRRRATALQSVGWMTIVFAILLAMMTVNTALGYAFCAITLLALFIFFEYKFVILLTMNISKQPAMNFSKELSSQRFI